MSELYILFSLDQGRFWAILSLFDHPISFDLFFAQPMGLQVQKGYNSCIFRSVSLSSSQYSREIWAVMHFLVKVRQIDRVIASKSKICVNFFCWPIKKVPSQSGNRSVVILSTLYAPPWLGTWKFLTPHHFAKYLGFGNVTILCPLVEFNSLAWCSHIRLDCEGLSPVAGGLFVVIVIVQAALH